MRGLLDQGQRVFRMYLHHFHDRVPLPKLNQHLAMIAAIEKGDAEAAERPARPMPNADRRGRQDPGPIADIALSLTKRAE